jgi:choline dehydrogenase-like flavoprotein
MNILRHGDYEEGATYDAEVVVVGTGAGGAVVGAELAEAGYDVILVEEGGYHPTSSFSPYLSGTQPRLYRDNGGTVIMGNPPIPYAEGRCVGGSTVINGGMTWRPIPEVLEDWEKMLGLEMGAKGLDPYFSRVEERISAKPQIPASIGDDNRVMAQGAKKLGWEYVENHRAQDSCVGANSCILGCPTGAKQSTLVSYMPRAFEAGARCLTELRVDELIIEGGRCVGVRGRAVNPRTRRDDQRVTLRARAVVLAAGAIHTPNILLQYRAARRSGQLGKNFLCHPNAKVVARYPFDVKGWQGASQGGQIREFRRDGIVMAENFIPPAIMAAQIHGHGEEAWEVMKGYNHMVASGVLVEDTRAGHVTRAFGRPTARYNITKLDHERFLRGVRYLAELHFAMGAEKVFLPFPNLTSITSPDQLSLIEKTQRSPSTLELFTVHLMGTCRMGDDDRASVVDMKGELWDLPGCYVADASLFPTAVGTNPQITIMALATKVAHRMAETLARA